MYILSDTLQSSIIEIIFEEEGNRYSYSSDGSWCQNLQLFVELWANTHQTDDITLQPRPFT